MSALTDLVTCAFDESIWEFPKMRGTFLGDLIIRILLFRVLY